LIRTGKFKCSFRELVYLTVFVNLLCDTTFKTSLYLQACLKTPEEKSETIVNKRQTIHWPKEQGQKDILWSTKYYTES